MRLQSRSKRVCLCLAPPLFRFLITCSIATVVAVIGVLVYNSPPFATTFSGITIDYQNVYNPIQQGLVPWDPSFRYNVIFEAHSHTLYSDGRFTPEQLIQYHIANGFNAIAITDHNTIDGALEGRQIAQAKYSDQIVVIIGEEWTNCRVHMGFLGLTEVVPPIKNPTDQDIQDAINNVHRQGGVVIYNHIPWSYYAGLDTPSKEQLVAWGVDYFDITTENVLDLQTLYWAKSIGKGIIAGTDVHSGGPVNEWTLIAVDGYPTDETGNGTLPNPEAIVRTLAQNYNSTSFIFGALGSPSPVTSQTKPNPTYIFATPWLLVGDFFHSFFARTNSGPYSFVDGFCGTATITIFYSEIFACFGWFIFAFIVAEGIRFLIGKLTNRWCAKVSHVLSGTKPPRDEHDPSLTPLMDIWR